MPVGLQLTTGMADGPLFREPARAWRFPEESGAFRRDRVTPIVFPLKRARAFEQFFLAEKFRFSAFGGWKRICLWARTERLMLSQRKGGRYAPPIPVTQKNL